MNEFEWRVAENVHGGTGNQITQIPSRPQLQCVFILAGENNATSALLGWIVCSQNLAFLVTAQIRSWQCFCQILKLKKCKSITWHLPQDPQYTSSPTGSGEASSIQYYTTLEIASCFFSGSVSLSATLSISQLGCAAQGAWCRCAGQRWSMYSISMDPHLHGNSHAVVLNCEWTVLLTNSDLSNKESFKRYGVFWVYQFAFYLQIKCCFIMSSPESFT